MGRAGAGPRRGWAPTLGPGERGRGGVEEEEQQGRNRAGIDGCVVSGWALRPPALLPGGANLKI
jgi:hypothetical protein